MSSTAPSPFAMTHLAHIAINGNTFIAARDLTDLINAVTIAIACSGLAGVALTWEGKPMTLSDIESTLRALAKAVPRGYHRIVVNFKTAVDINTVRGWCIIDPCNVAVEYVNSKGNTISQLSDIVNADIRDQASKTTEPAATD